MSLSNKTMLACILVALAALHGAAVAGSSPVTKPETQSQNQTDEKRKTLLADATSAIQETQSALKHLDDGKTKDAVRPRSP